MSILRHQSGIVANRYISIDRKHSRGNISRYVHIPPSEDLLDLEKKYKSRLETKRISLNQLSAALVAWRKTVGDAVELKPALWKTCPGGLAVPIPILRRIASDDFRILEGECTAAALFQLDDPSLEPAVLQVAEPL